MREGDDLGSTPEREFAQDCGDVALDDLDRHGELGGDLAVRSSHCEEGEHVAFPVGERIERIGDTVDAGHRDVHHDDVWLRRPRQSESATA